MDAFADVTDRSMLVERATSLWSSFVSISGHKISPQKSFDEKIFTENSWLLTQDDGAPLPEDNVATIPYRASCYARVRQEQKIKDGKLKKKVEIKPALKIRDIDPETFNFPTDDDEDVDTHLDCDIHSDYHRFTFKMKGDELDKVVEFDTFEDVLDVFPDVAEYFELPPKTFLPKRHSYVAHRFRWKSIMVPHVELSCDLDLRFQSIKVALAGANPFYGEFSCRIDVFDTITRYQDLSRAVDNLASIFNRFQSSIDKDSFPLTT